MLQNIKKLEYRKEPDGTEVVDILYDDRTKMKLPVAKIEEEKALIDSEIEALRRRRRLLVKMQNLIDANRTTPEDAQILDPNLIP